MVQITEHTYHSETISNNNLKGYFDNFLCIFSVDSSCYVDVGSILQNHNRFWSSDWKRMDQFRAQVSDGKLWLFMLKDPRHYWKPAFIVRTLQLYSKYAEYSHLRSAAQKLCFLKKKMLLHLDFELKVHFNILDSWTIKLIIQIKLWEPEKLLWHFCLEQSFHWKFVLITWYQILHWII